MFLVLPAAGGEPPEVTLENAEGKQIKATLLEKSSSWVKFERAGKVFKLPLDKLSEDSAKLVRKADIPVALELEIKFDMQVEEEKGITKSGTPEDSNGSDPYDRQTVGGKVSVENQDLSNPSPAGVLHVAVLREDGGDLHIMYLDEYPLQAMEPMKSAGFVVQKTSCHPTSGGSSSGVPEPHGHHAGHIAVLVVEGRIAKIKASPAELEEDLEKITELMGLDADPGPE